MNNLSLAKSLAKSIISENVRVNDQWEEVKNNPTEIQKHAHNKNLDILDHASYHLVAALSTDDEAEEVTQLLETHRILLLRIGTNEEA